MKYPTKYLTIEDKNGKIWPEFCLWPLSWDGKVKAEYCQPDIDKLIERHKKEKIKFVEVEINKIRDC